MMKDDEKTREELLGELRELRSRFAGLEPREIRSSGDVNEALRESEERFRMLAEYVPAGIVIVNSDLTADYVNPGFTAITGYTIDDIPPGQPWAGDFPASHREAKITVSGKEPVPKNLAGDSGFADRKVVLTCKDGTEKTISLRVVIMDNGKYLATYEDVTDRVRSEERLKESARFLKNIIDFLPDGAVVIDPAGRVVAWNLAMEDLTGVKAEEILGKGNYEYALPFYGERRPILVDLVLRPQQDLEGGYRDVKRQNGTLTGEVFIPTLQGRRACLLGTAAPLLDTRGTIIGAIETIRDVTTSRNAEDALQAKTEELDRFFTLTLDLLCIADTDGYFRRLNPQWEKTLGYSMEMLEGTKFLDLVHPEDLESTLRAVQGLSDGKETLNLVNRYRCIDGSYRWIEWRSCPAGNLVYTAARDITERKLDEEVMRESLLRFESVIENAPMVAIQSFDRGGTIRRWNNTSTDLYGYSITDVIGKRLQHVMLHSAAAEEFETTIEKIWRTGRVAGPNEWQTFHRSGKELWIYATMFPVLEEGDVAEIFCMEIDITHRKLMEKALKESEQKYRNIFENSIMGIFQMTPDGRFVSVNHALVKMFGFSAPEEMIENSAGTGREGFSDYRNLALMKAAMEEQGFVEGFESQRYRKDGSPFWTAINGRAVRDAQGTILYYEGTVEDITHRKVLESQLIQSQKMEAIGTLAGGIAHDFNNLLMGILGYTSLVLMDTHPGHPSYDKLKRVEDQVQSGAELTRQLLGFARGGKYEVRSTDLNELLGRSSEMFGRTKKEITICRKYQDDLWTVEVDRGQIEQVLLNLFVNAWQAMPAGGELYLETRNVILDEHYRNLYSSKPGRYVKISVTDTGTGMDEVTRQRIFEPFFTTKEMGRGTGLGLASAYGIIKNHGGIINVYSEQGKGTTFTVYLPVSGLLPEEEETPLPESVVKGTETLLLVDDQEMVLETGKAMLGVLGYRVLTAAGGRKAVSLYRDQKERIDLVILDMIMPDMSGAETYEHLKDINPAVKAILSSGYSLNGEATHILTLGCNGFVQKPFTLQEISTKIREVLDH
jgi:two-component system cell cycle sensor histidine kinase/response regulator CckA